MSASGTSARFRLAATIGRVGSVTAGALVLAACSETPLDTVAKQWPILEQYCTDCHNDSEHAGGLSLSQLDAEHVPQDPEIWENVVRKLRGHLMPPPGARRPANERMDAFVVALEAYLDAAAAAAQPGRVAAHRLNRNEYAAAVRELLGIRIDAQAMLPADLSSDGFDNIASVLGMSPTHLDRYIAAARDISEMAVGEPQAPAARFEYGVERENQTAHLDGLPLGTRGGLLVRHHFPADGEYIFSLDVASVPAADLRAYPHGWLDYRHRVILTVDGRKVFEGELGGEEDLRAVDQQQISAVEAIKDRFRNIRLSVKAGDREIGAAFVARSRAESDYRLHSFIPGETLPDVPRMRSLQIVGPYGPQGIGEPTPSRQRIFGCYPEAEPQELPCAKQILSELARRAFRRPIMDTDLEPLLAFYRSGHDAGGFETGIQRGLMAILASTRFLYRVESEPSSQDLEPGDVYPIGDIELASRLAFFLWGSGPDDTLLELAEQGGLRNRETYAAQIERMLADSKSESLITHFAFQWLGLRRLAAIDPDPKLYPTFDEDLRDALEREMELYLDSVLRNPDASVIDLLTARHTFLNERLARHYGIGTVRGDRFRRVELADPRRFGLLGKGGVLMVTSYPDRTSPVLRGAWIMEHLLGAPPAPVPADVETDLAPLPGDVPRSVRERLALHRDQPSCNQCHGVIDPIGQALENFGPLGEWRDIEIDSGVAIDSHGQLADGVHVESPMDLREALLAEPERFVQTLTEKLLTYALGRTLEHYDMPVVRAIVRDAAAQGYTFSSIVSGIAHSAPFRMRTVPAPATEGELQAASENVNEAAGGG